MIDSYADFTIRHGSSQAVLSEAKRIAERLLENTDSAISVRLLWDMRDLCRLVDRLPFQWGGRRPLEHTEPDPVTELGPGETCVHGAGDG